MRAYIDDLLILSNSSRENHLNELDKVFKRSKNARHKANAKKLFFGLPELEYLGFWITYKDIMPLSNKVQDIQKLSEPKTKNH